MHSLPGVRELVRLPHGAGDRHLALTHWILSSKSFAVKTLQKDEVHEYLKNICNNLFVLIHLLLCVHCVTSPQYSKLCNLMENEGISAPVPDFLFELEYCDQMNARFEKMREDKSVFYAFHGSRLENFHSIIHNGLHCHLNKVSVSILLIHHCGKIMNCPGNDSSIIK